MKTFKRAWVLAIFIFILLTGCNPIVGVSQAAMDAAPTKILPGKTGGQTFNSRHAGLSAIDLYLIPDAHTTGKIRLYLRSAPPDRTDITDLATSAVSIKAGTQPGYIRFSFPAQAGSYLKDYTIVVENLCDGAIGLGSASGDSYLEGSAYLDGQPQDAQLAFRLAYDPWQMSLGLLKQGAIWLGFLLAAAFLFILPGWALLRWLFSGWKSMIFLEKMGMAAGLSLVTYPILILWTGLVRLQLGPGYAWLPPLAGLAYLAWANRQWRPELLKAAWTNWRRWKPSASAWPNLAAFLTIALIVFVRLWVIRPLTIPMWGDSYQHTLIAQLIVDNKGLFNSWQPYTDLTTLTYHFGFHSLAAVFHWITALDLPQAILYTGQMVNILAIIALYPLTLRISRNRWAGVAVMLITGLVSPLPMQYVNWGRYTQLAGQVIMPAAVLCLWQVFREKRPTARSLILCSIVLAGLGLTHYRVFLLTLLFVPAYAIVYFRRATIKPLALRILLVGAGSSLLFLPWFIHLFSGYIMKMFGAFMITLPSQAPQFTQEYNAISSVFDYLSPVYWVLMAFSLAAGLWKRNFGVGVFSLWWGFIVLGTNPQWLQLPGQGAISSFALVIAAYIPIGVLIASTAGSYLSNAPLFSTKWMGAALLAITLILGLYSARQRINDVKINTFSLATRPDIRAANWIKSNTPAESGFLVNAFFAYGNTSVVGSDGGWWLPLLANRRTNLPPLTYTAEQGPTPDYISKVNDFIRMIQLKGIDHPDTLAMMQTNHYDYIYIGQRQGRVNYDGTYSFNPQKLLTDHNFRLAYHQDRVWIFQRVSATGQ